MQNNDIQIPDIPESELTPLVKLLLAIIANQSTVISKQAEQISKQAEQISKQAEQIQRAKEQIQGLRDDIAVLKGEKAKPKVPKSTLEDPDKGKEKNPNEQRPGSAKRSKTAELVIHETICLTPEGVKEGWIFKGYNDFNVPGLVIEPITPISGYSTILLFHFTIMAARQTSGKRSRREKSAVAPRVNLAARFEIPSLVLSVPAESLRCHFGSISKIGMQQIKISQV